MERCGDVGAVKGHCRRRGQNIEVEPEPIVERRPDEAVGVLVFFLMRPGTNRVGLHKLSRHPFTTQRRFSIGKRMRSHTDTGSSGRDKCEVKDTSGEVVPMLQRDPQSLGTRPPDVGIIPPDTMSGVAGRPNETLRLLLL